MREIKFRGKEGKTGKWIYGAFFKHERYTRCPFITSGEEVPPPEYIYLIINSGFSDWNLPRPIDAYSVDPATVGQYTGLKDKNGVEIYEGDVVKADMDFGPGGMMEQITNIYWDEYTGGWQFNYFDKSTIEVIGNIYENPELLEARM